MPEISHFPDVVFATGMFFPAFDFALTIAEMFLDKSFTKYFKKIKNYDCIRLYDG